MPDGPQHRSPWTPVLMTLTLLAMLALGAFGGCTAGFIGAMGLARFETWPLTVGLGLVSSSHWSAGG